MEILEVIKYGAVIFLPLLLSKLIWMAMRLRFIISNLKSVRKRVLKAPVGIVLVLLHFAFSVIRIFFFESENFFSAINARLDSPSYMVRNHYRAFLEQWFENNPTVKELRDLKEGGADLSGFPNQALVKEYELLEFLSEQLKIKEKKEYYCKFGEYAFINCNYCTKPLDYVLFLVPSIILSHIGFLAVVGVLSGTSAKRRWRTYGIAVSVVLVALEAFVYLGDDKIIFDGYDSIFGPDFYTIKSEKIIWIRNIVFNAFLLIALIFDLPEDLNLENTVDRIKLSVSKTALLLRSMRIQNAAVSNDENLSKFASQVAMNTSGLESLLASGQNFSTESLIQLSSAVEVADKIVKRPHN